MRKVHVEVTVDLYIETKEGVAISDVIDEMFYTFNSRTEGAEIKDTTIEDFEVITEEITN